MNAERINNFKFLDDTEAREHGGNFRNISIAKSLKTSNPTTKCYPGFVSIKKLNLGSDEMQNLLVKNETSIVKNLSHPNIVNFLEVVDTASCSFIVMELFRFGDLERYSSIASLTKFDIYTILEQVVNALHYLHKTCKVMHRDVKLSNILVEQTSNYGWIIKLCDFGISYCYNDGDKKIERMCGGTYQYMAPEIMQNKPHSYPVDMWGLGVCMYRLFTKAFPFNLPKGGHSFDARLMVYDEPENFTAMEKILLASLLFMDPGDRISTTTALMLCKECKKQARENDVRSRYWLTKQGIL